MGKDAKKMQRPFITLVVWGTSVDKPLEHAQNSLPAAGADGVNLVFGHSFKVQTGFSQVAGSAVIFIEVKHFKPKEKKTSTRAWTFIPGNKMQPGALELPLYQKPVDPSLKRLKPYNANKPDVKLELVVE